MTRISDEAVAAVAKRLYRWSTEQGQSYAYQNVRAALQTAHLTDDGATDTPPADLAGVGAPSAAESATTTAAPSSPHLVVDRDALIALQKAHRYVADSNLGEPGCACGLEFPGGFDYIEHAEHVAGRVLSLLGRAS